MALLLACVESVFCCAVFALLLPPIEPIGVSLPGGLQAPAAVLLFAGCCIAALAYAGLYDRRSAESRSACLLRLARAGVLAAVPLIVLAMLFLPAGPASWLRLVTALVLTGAAVIAGRAAWHRMARRPPFVEQVAVLGKSPLAKAVLAELRARRDCRIVAYEQGRFLRRGQDAAAHPRPAAESRPHRIVVALRERRGLLPVAALLDAKRQGVVVEDGIPVYERLTGKVAIESLHPSQVIFSDEFGRSTSYDRAARAISFVAAGLGLALTAPLLLVLAILIKLDSRGPVLFVQGRIGKDGRIFPLMKFRTMHPAGERRSEWVRDNGDRITRVGRWLRKFRLDELPQLFNVVAGHMNLVGPRPHPATNYALFTEHIPFYAFRSMVRPGITGWAQVRYGYANSLKEETDKMRYDLYYIKHRSLLFDLDIVLLTVKVVLLGSDSKLEGAAVSAEPLLEERIDAA
jgi:exopolysaccharide biosynthesis polyprenyl glycosylphosphotransferase